MLPGNTLLNETNTHTHTTQLDYITNQQKSHSDNMLATICAFILMIQHCVDPDLTSFSFVAWLSLLITELRVYSVCAWIIAVTGV